MYSMKAAFEICIALSAPSKRSKERWVMRIFMFASVPAIGLSSLKRDCNLCKSLPFVVCLGTNSVGGKCLAESCEGGIF